MKEDQAVRETKRPRASSARKPSPSIGERTGQPQRAGSYASFPGVKEILVPIDFSPFSRTALDYALPFAEKFGANISLLYVLEKLPYMHDFEATSPLMAKEADLMAEAKKQLNAERKEGKGARYIQRVLVRSGEPRREICNVAEDLSADLIIMATHGYSGLKHVLLGSTAEHVLRHAPCPVLALRQPNTEAA